MIPESWKKAFTIGIMSSAVTKLLEFTLMYATGFELSDGLTVLLSILYMLIVSTILTYIVFEYKHDLRYIMAVPPLYLIIKDLRNYIFAKKVFTISILGTTLPAIVILLPVSVGIAYLLYKILE